MNSCYLCGGSNFKNRKGQVRDNPSLKVLECTSCGLVFLSSFEHIIDGFYENSGMHRGEVSIKSWLMETALDDERRFNFMRRVIENKKVLDFGCGNAGFLLKAKEVANYVEGIELEDKFHKHFADNNLTIHSNVDKTETVFDIITLFHVLEHIADPIRLLNEITTKLSDQGQLIIEVPNAADILLTLYDSEAFSKFTYWSCHLFLFNQFTLTMLAERAGLRVNYVKQIQRYPLSNHLYWLAKERPGGHCMWSFLDSAELFNAYEKQLASMGCCDTLVASFSKM